MWFGHEHALGVDPGIHLQQLVADRRVPHQEVVVGQHDAALARQVVPREQEGRGRDAEPLRRLDRRRRDRAVDVRRVEHEGRRGLPELLEVVVRRAQQPAGPALDGREHAQPEPVRERNAQRLLRDPAPALALLPRLHVAPPPTVLRGVRPEPAPVRHVEQLARGADDVALAHALERTETAEPVAQLPLHAGTRLHRPDLDVDVARDTLQAAAPHEVADCLAARQDRREGRLARA
jgi:hypothetical protein